MDDINITNQCGWAIQFLRTWTGQLLTSTKKDNVVYFQIFEFV